MSQSTYFGSHSAGVGKVRVADSSQLLNAVKIQTIQNSTRSDGFPVQGHLSYFRPQMISQFNPTLQQIRYGVYYQAPNR